MFQETDAKSLPRAGKTLDPPCWLYFDRVRCTSCAARNASVEGYKFTPESVEGISVHKQNSLSTGNLMNQCLHISTWHKSEERRAAPLTSVFAGGGDDAGGPQSQV